MNAGQPVCGQPLVPRPDQVEARDAIISAIDAGVRRPLAVAPMAFGKSLVAAMLASTFLSRGWRTLILAHRRELLEQNSGTLRRYDPGADVGICSASLKADNTAARIVVGGTATVYRRLEPYPCIYDRRRHKPRLGQVDALIVDECFPAGTLVDGRPIETVRAGDEVRSFDEEGQIVSRCVVRTFRRHTDTVVCISFSSGRLLVATPNHPLLTNEGWTNAISLAAGNRVYVDSLHVVRDSDGISQWLRLGPLAAERQAILQQCVPGCVQAKTQRRDDSIREPAVCIAAHAGHQPNAQKGKPREDACDFAENWPPTLNTRRQWQADAAPAGDVVESIGAQLDGGASDPHGEPAKARRASHALQNRYRASRIEDCHRSRWREPCPRESADAGCQEDRVSTVDWVDRVEVFQRGCDDEFEQLCPGGFVYNLEVGDTHTYFANGIAVHNCHRLGPGGSTMLARIIEALGNPPVIGLTATPFRGDGTFLVDEGLFETIVFNVTITEALDQGILCPLTTKAPRDGRIDLSRVRVTAGEFNAADLEAAAMAGDVTAQAVARTVEIARSEERKSWLIFASGVAHAQQIGEELARRGVSHAVVVGDTDSDERADAIARFRGGMLTALVNCNVFTEGFDATNIDLIAFMRATCSPVLWVQAAGRGMRIHPGKQNCRLLDFGNNILRHGPIDNVTLRKSGERHDADRGTAKIRICPRCDEVNKAGTTVCTACGEPLVKSRVGKLVPVASELEVIGGQRVGNWACVFAMRGHIHHKPGSSVSFRINYHTDIGLVSDFLPLEHPSSGARWHAFNKWRQLSRQRHIAPPASAAEANDRFHSGELRQPARVLVERDGAWWRIKAQEFAA